MYHILLFIQYISIILMFIEIIYVLIRKPSRQQQIFLITYISLLMTSVGYLFEMKATTAEQAIMAVKFNYFGKPFVALALFIFQMAFFKSKLKAGTIKLLTCIHIVTVVLVQTFEYHQLYYTSYEFVQDGMFPHLKFGHGIYYVFYNGLVMAYLIILTVKGAIRYQRTHNNRERRQIAQLMAVNSVMVLGYIIFLSGITKGYDSTLLGYLICTIIITVSMFKDGLLDTLSLARELAIDMLSEGVIVLDNEGKLVYFNEKAGQIYHNLKTQINR